MKKREAKIKRKTNETDIEVYINLDGEGNSSIRTGIGFFDHMLSLFAKHGLIDLNIKAKGDTFVDCHHTVEDVGIVLGQCINKSLGNKEGIKRYGTSFVPMDESLALVSIDLSGRPYLLFHCNFTVDKIGEFDTEMTEEFFRALAFNSLITLHGKLIYGSNNHHKVEALFKALGRALREAASYDDRIEGVNSTKGLL